MCIFKFPVYTKKEMVLLAQKASSCAGTAGFRTCTYFYRDKNQDYYNYIFDKRQGIMEKYEKDSHGDPANPINAQISGLFFSATMDRLRGGPLRESIFGDRRVKLQPSLLLNENVNLYFADFYCINKTHWVQLALAENGTKADELCRKLLIQLDKYKNPFLYISKADTKSIQVTTGVAVEVFYTHDVNLPACGIPNKYCIENVMSRGPGGSRIGGIKKKEYCLTCNIK